jgi:hypothetical protein
MRALFSSEIDSSFPRQPLMSCSYPIETMAANTKAVKGAGFREQPFSVTR